MPLKTAEGHRQRERVLGEECTLRTHLFLFQNLGSSLEMKTQTDKANLKRAVVKSVPGRGRVRERSR